MKVLGTNNLNPHISTSSRVADPANQERVNQSSAKNFNTLPVKIQCDILKYLQQSELLRCRLLSHHINKIIETHFVFNVTINDINLKRAWNPRIQLPWKKISDARKENPCNSLKRIIVGELRHTFKKSLDFVAGTIEEIEFTQPTSIRNIQKILKDCRSSHILRLHSSVFIGGQTCSCTKAKFSKIEIDMNRLSRLYIIFDNMTMNEKTPCTVPYWLKINIQSSPQSSRYDLSEIQFIPEGLEDAPLEIFKTWIVDDEILDIFSRPDILRKISYFATVTEAELREVTIKFVPHISIPSSIHYTNVIHHPDFYAPLKKYPIGPFNGTMLTYFSTEAKQILTYRPIHLHSDAVVLSYPDAVQLLVSEKSSS